MIRFYKPTDKEQVVELLRFNIPRFFHPDEEPDFVAYLAQHAQQYVVVEEHGNIIGSGGFSGDFDEGKTARLAWDVVHPQWQGRGVGRKLTQYRIDEIRKNAQVEVIIVRTTQLAYKFYEKMGFKLQYIEPDFWAPAFDLYQMALPLKAASTP